MNRQLLQSWLLRLAGLAEILAFIAVVMPRSWMEASHAWLGLGVMPVGTIIMFLTRRASYVYGVHGIFLCVLASDVVRFRPLVRLNGASFLVASPVFLIIDYTSGTPFYWTVIDTVGCAFLGGALLWLDRGGSDWFKQEN
jgi:hypothetical protein